MNPEVQPTPSQGEKHLHSAADVRRAIDGLQDTDYAKLMLIASSFARRRLRGTSVEPEDLVQDAITKTLDGTRAWSRGIPILKHLDRVMESDSGHIAEQRRTRPEQAMPETDDDEPAATTPGPSVVAEARDELTQLLELFELDGDARSVIDLKAIGYSASEIQAKLGITHTQYDTITKRIRRRVARHISEGDS